ncbi:GNAT family N-acetyltransferase [Nocardia takedensis]|uniref:GNAT family N-acetyltransferase n=1 Tax=Nocardia takedensis TaxID=259390 RepID=UPI000A07B664|nr:GNAT family N-acetyltransferase [Nocardia takedensis]
MRDHARVAAGPVARSRHCAGVTRTGRHDSHRPAAAQQIESRRRSRPHGDTPPGFLVFEKSADGVLVGGATVQPGGDVSSRTLGWWIGSEDRRAGYASEAVAALVEAIHAAGFTTVEIGTNETNLAVRRICDRIGATEKDRRAQPLPDGSVVPGIWHEHRQVSAEKP